MNIKNNLVALYLSSVCLYCMHRGSLILTESRQSRITSLLRGRLSGQEAARLFPVFDEMRGKQRVYFDKLRAIHSARPSSEREAVR